MRRPRPQPAALLCWSVLLVLCLPAVSGSSAADDQTCAAQPAAAASSSSRSKQKAPPSADQVVSLRSLPQTAVGRFSGVVQQSQPSWRLLMPEHMCQQCHAIAQHSTSCFLHTPAACPSTWPSSCACCRPPSSSPSFIRSAWLVSRLCGSRRSRSTPLTLSRCGTQPGQCLTTASATT